MSWRDRLRQESQGKKKAREVHHSPPREHLERVRQIDEVTHEQARKAREAKK